MDPGPLSPKSPAGSKKVPGMDYSPGKSPLLPAAGFAAIGSPPREKPNPLTELITNSPTDPRPLLHVSEMLYNELTKKRIKEQNGQLWTRQKPEKAKSSPVRSFFAARSATTHQVSSANETKNKEESPPKGHRHFSIWTLAPKDMDMTQESDTADSAAPSPPQKGTLYHLPVSPAPPIPTISSEKQDTQVSEHKNTVGNVTQWTGWSSFLVVPPKSKLVIHYEKSPDLLELLWNSIAYEAFTFDMSKEEPASQIVAYLNSDDTIDRLIHLLTESLSENDMAILPPEIQDASLYFQQYCKNMQSSISSIIIPHIKVEKWTNERLMRIVNTLRNLASSASPQESFEQLDSIFRLIDIIGSRNPQLLVNFFSICVPDFCSILESLFWHRGVIAILTSWISLNAPQSSPAWMVFFEHENRMLNMVKSVLRNYSDLNHNKGPACSAYWADIALDHVDQLVCGHLFISSESKLGISFRSEEFVSLLLDIALDEKFRLNATTRSISIVKSLLIWTFSSPRSSYGSAVVSLLVSPSGSCQPHLLKLQSVLRTHRSNSVVLELVEMISLLTRLDNKPLVETMLRTGTINTALDACFYMRPYASVIHSAATTLISNLTLLNSHYAPVVAWWIKESDFVPKLMAAVEKDVDTPFHLAPGYTQQLMVIAANIAYLYPLSELLGQAIGNYNDRWQPLMTKVASLISERKTWENSRVPDIFPNFELRDDDADVIFDADSMEMDQFGETINNPIFMGTEGDDECLDPAAELEKMMTDDL